MARRLLWPPRTQQVIGDELCLPYKIVNWQTYFGFDFFLSCYTTPNAECVVMEQPDTIIQVSTTRQRTG